MSSILVVEDDIAVAEALCQVLERMGHETRVAIDGEDGIQKFQQAGYDLVITDILMPRKGGMEVIKELIKLDPEVKIVAISGGNPNVSAEDCLRTPTFLAERTLTKPFTRRQIETVVDKLLARPGIEDWSVGQESSTGWSSSTNSDSTSQ